MRVSRRRLVGLIGSVTALPLNSLKIFAQSYPSRPVRIVVGTSPGGPQDLLSRLISQWLSERLGQPFIVDNRPGAGTNIATEVVVRAPPDGHTLLSIAPSSAINATLYEKLPFNFVRDVSPVAVIVKQPQVMVVHPSVPAETLADFIAYCRTNPGRLNMASSGIGTGPHLAGELFKLMSAVDMVHVPYRGAGPATADLIAGLVQVMFVASVAAMEHIKARTLRALAVTSATRSNLLPNTPAVGEFIPGYEASVWFGIGAPKSTPAEVIETLNREINAGLVNPQLRARLTELGGGEVISSPAEFAKLIFEETTKWAAVIKSLGIKAD